jgi:hypothetical protein
VDAGRLAIRRRSGPAVYVLDCKLLRDEVRLEGDMLHLRRVDDSEGDVAYVDSDKLADWLRLRPIDLHDERKREIVREWLGALPRA